MAKAKKVLKKTDVYVADYNIELIKACVENDSAVLMIGETGTGKTSIVREVANDHKKNLIRVSVNGSMGVEEILGKWLVNEGTTVWQDGILTSAIRQGDWVVLDEINAALPEILFVLHSLLDDDRKIYLPEKDNEEVRPHKDFRFFATMNPPEEYAGTKDMNKALMSRFGAVLQINVLDSVSEAKLLEDKGAKADDALKLVTLASILRSLKSKDEIFFFCSTRDLVQAVDLINAGLKIEHAVLGAIVNKMSIEEYKIAGPKIESHIKMPPKISVESVQELMDSVIKIKGEMANMKKLHKEEIDKVRAEATKTTVKDDAVRADFLAELQKIVKK